MTAMIIINGLVLSLTYFLIASGLTIVFSIMGLINFAHGAIIMLGGMISYYAFAFLGINFYFSIILAMGLTAILSVVLKRVVFDYFANFPLAGCIASVGIAMIIQQGALVALGGEDKVFANALPQDLVNLFGLTVSMDRIIVVLVSFVIMVGMLAFLQFAKAGLIIRATTQEPIASQLCGVNIGYVSAISMAMGGALAGAAGALLGALFTVSPYWGESLILKAFVVIIIGGLGSVLGAIVGSFILGFVESIGITLSGYITFVLVFVLIVILLLLKPKGILGHE
jgi:branched-chain amino acid transport system permease protein